MTANTFQVLAARTIRTDLTNRQMKRHALFGMCSEVGELQGLHQKVYQGHELDEDHAKKELGDLLWFVAEYCTAEDWTLSDVMQTNVDKLKKRYPDGFDAEKSLNRAEGDI
jgi:NTP pyrophosphatase (non-canonical NTP hydrolase)